MGRTMGALAASLIAALAAILVGEVVTYWFYPDNDPLMTLVDMPIGAQAMTGVTWLLAGLAAAVTAVWLDGRAWLALPAAGIAVALAGYSVSGEPHPPWLMAAKLLGPLLVGLTVAMIARRA